ncbi:MAG: metal-dependent hydrolase [Myxococcaceae bacterium]|nr:metal-dependent hydrolase [Myxococcaceae bacterium]
MAAFGHLAVAFTAGRVIDRPRPLGWMALFSALSMLPDVDVIAFVFRVPYEHPLGHRGATHSIAFAVLCGVAALLVRRDRRLALFTTAVVLTHPLLDMLTDGGLGCALFWPISNERLFWPVQPLPVAPIGHGMFSRRGLYVVIVEVLAFLPLVVFAFWPRRSARS